MFGGRARTAMPWSEVVCGMEATQPEADVSNKVSFPTVRLVLVVCYSIVTDYVAVDAH